MMSTLTVYNNPGGGNCAYHAIAQGLLGAAEYDSLDAATQLRLVHELRQIVARAILTPTVYERLRPFFSPHAERGYMESPEKYAEYVKLSNSHADIYTLIALPIACGICIQVHTFRKTESDPSHNTVYLYTQCYGNNTNPVINLMHTSYDQDLFQEYCHYEYGGGDSVADDDVPISLSQILTERRDGVVGGQRQSLPTRTVTLPAHVTTTRTKRAFPITIPLSCLDNLRSRKRRRRGSQ